MSTDVGLPQIKLQKQSGTNNGGPHRPHCVRLAHSSAQANRADLSFLMAPFLLRTMKRLNIYFGTKRNGPLKTIRWLALWNGNVETATNSL